MPDVLYPVAKADYRVTGEWANSPSYYAQFGQRGHNGVDVGVLSGTPVYALDDGVIEFAGWGGNHPWAGAVAGNYVLARHWWGYSGYAHLKTWNVLAGQRVKRGQQVAYSGNTSGVAGGTTGDHLHYETLPLNPNFHNGFAGRVNPAALVNFVGFPGSTRPHDTIGDTPMKAFKASSTALKTPQEIPGDGKHHLIRMKSGKATRKRQSFLVGPVEMSQANVEVRATGKPGTVVTLGIHRYGPDGKDAVITRIQETVGADGVLRAVIPVSERLTSAQGLYVRARATSPVRATILTARGWKQR